MATVQKEQEPYVQLILSVLKSEFLHVLERNPSGAVRQSAMGFSHLHSFPYLSTLLIVPVKQQNEVKKLVWTRNTHGGLRSM